ncbi:ISAzo13 family transposase [Rhodoplanes roseus]|uniref:ISAzo13 family transposase n=1 Tax=Rhodoplanes roseus TaxID=29409 RepID=A0A327L567_9BRAD|nr:ISAzo13 family transposase [Rhodoplanes roseus]RAI45324.1 ISAzo13 family transposase [Rhodoplanes roseus]
MVDDRAIRMRYLAVKPVLDERGRRRFAAAEAMAAGRGGIATVSRITGIARSTIGRGLAELRGTSPPEATPGRVRRKGAGRPALVDSDSTLLEDLVALVEPSTRGDPMAPLKWTAKSLRRLSAELGRLGHRISPNVVGEVLHGLGYSLQANRKTKEGADHPDRDAQFTYINEQVQAAITAGEPAISVDTKKKELVGDFKNGGREWCPKGRPERVRVHDFLVPELGRASPYGVYDIADNAGWVSVGIDNDTASFAVNSIRRWWKTMGRTRHPHATKLLITADAGGSNGARVRLWKRELQTLATELGIPITVCHLPPGPSKWNRIEHRLFSVITQNWRGKPLVSLQTIVQLIAATTTDTGLKVRCEIDPNTYPAGVKISDQVMDSIALERHPFHGDWNYTIRPKTPVPKR